MLINKHIGVPFEDYFEENKRLIYKFMHRKKQIMTYNFLETDDVFSVCSIGFINAYKTYVPNVNGKNVSFSTHLEYQMMNEFTKFLRSHDISLNYSPLVKEIASFINLKDVVYLPIDEIFILCKNKFGEKKVSKNLVKFAIDYINNRVPYSLDLLVKNKDEEENIYFSSFIGFNDDDTHLYLDEFIQQLTKREKEVVNLLMQGENLVQIGKKLNISAQYIGVIRKNIKKKYYDFYDVKIKEDLDKPKLIKVDRGLKIMNTFGNRNPILKSQNEIDAFYDIRDTTDSYVDISKRNNLDYDRVKHIGKAVRSPELRKNLSNQRKSEVLMRGKNKGGLAHAK